MIETILFYLFASVAIGSALLMVTQRNPIASALYLILNFFCLAGFYLILHAQFIAVIQIIVYAGAIMVLFLFVIMLLNLRDERSLLDEFSWKKVLAGGLSGGVLLEIVYIISSSTSGLPVQQSQLSLEIGTVEFIGAQLFTRFLLPFEITSLLLTAAIVGAILLAKKKLD
jgi:NADH-quinone oxidoreductase subunit J